MRRHFTVTGFLVDGPRTLLHWHQKNQMWLPPGGHIEADEDPIEAVIREVEEETGVQAEVVAHVEAMGFDAPLQLAPPLTILVEDIPATATEAAHQHIDLIYALRAVAGAPAYAGGDFTWVDERQLREDEHLPVASCGVDMPVPEDVRALGLRAIELVRARG